MDAGGALQLHADGSGPPSRSATQPAAEDVALTLHTSGTTGRPKRVPLQHRHLAASVVNIVETYELGPNDVSFCVMPLFHVHGLVASTLATFGSGGTVVVPAPFNPLRFWTVAAAHGATWFSAVPTMQHMLLARAKAQSPVPSLRFVRTCSASLSPELMASIEQRIGVPVLEAYGMTEACHQMASNPLPPGERRPGSVGLATGVEVAIVDEEWHHLPNGQSGEVVVRGPNVISAYADAPEANASSFRDGWFRTGDEGLLDADGYLTLVARIKELINRGGEKIAPREVDEVLLSHPAVTEAVAFATPHPALGQDVAAAVVLQDEVTEAELIAYCRTRLAAFKVPRTIRIVDHLTRTATGKVQRGKVAESLGLGG
jgi:acyl-CoA synthetase (AMP-forming)/AMP-acid ligase II